MKLPAQPSDFLVLQLDPEGDGATDTDTTADLLAGQGADVPTIATGKWLPAIVVNVNDPDYVRLAEWQDGDWIHITSVSTDTITFARTDTARDLLPGEYVFINLSSYLMGVLFSKLEDLEYLTGVLTGGTDGIPAWGLDGAPDVLKVVQQSTPDMTVKVKAGVSLIGNEVARLRADTDSATITAPVTNNRIDLVQLKAGTGGLADSVSVKTGTENVSPVAPTVDAGCLALATILLTPSHTAIETADITDVRVRL